MEERARRSRLAGVVVLGLGNPVLGDDAAGLRVAEAVARAMAEEPVECVTVLTSARAGLEVIDLLAGATHAIIVDCLAAPAPVPGRIRRLSVEDCRGSGRLVGAHDVSLADALALARAAGVQMPEEVEVYGIESAGTDTIREGLSHGVDAAVRALAAAIHASLRQRAGGSGW